MHRALALLLLSLSACNARSPEAPEPAVALAPAAPDPPPAAPAASPAALYAACEARVEEPQAEGECTSDADCAAVGCSSEVCTTALAGADLMTPCDVEPCFAVLRACGCSDGTCTWTLKGASDRDPD